MPSQEPRNWEGSSPKTVLPTIIYPHFYQARDHFLGLFTLLASGFSQQELGLMVFISADGRNGWGPQQVGPERRLSTKELMLSNCAAGKDS